LRISCTICPEPPKRGKWWSPLRSYLNRLSRDATGDRGLLAEIAQAYDKTAAVQGWPSGPNLGHQRDALGTFGKAVAICLIWFGPTRPTPQSPPN